MAFGQGDCWREIVAWVRAGIVKGDVRGLVFGSDRLPFGPINREMGGVPHLPKGVAIRFVSAMRAEGLNRIGRKYGQKRRTGASVRHSDGRCHSSTAQHKDGRCALSASARLTRPRGPTRWLLSGRGKTGYKRTRPPTARRPSVPPQPATAKPRPRAAMLSCSRF
jgi:hypothetical protein